MVRNETKRRVRARRVRNHPGRSPSKLGNRCVRRLSLAGAKPSQRFPSGVRATDGPPVSPRPIAHPGCHACSGRDTMRWHWMPPSLRVPFLPSGSANPEFYALCTCCVRKASSGQRTNYAAETRTSTTPILFLGVTSTRMPYRQARTFTDLHSSLFLTVLRPRRASFVQREELSPTRHCKPAVRL